MRRTGRVAIRSVRMAATLAVLGLAAVACGGSADGQPGGPEAPASTGPSPAVDPFTQVQYGLLTVWADGAGSTAVVLDADGHLLTGPLLDEPESMQATIDGSEHQIEVVAMDPRSQLAVLRLPASVAPPVFGDSNQLAVGAEVRVIVPEGAPPPTPSAGHVTEIGNVLNGFGMLATDVVASGGGVLVNPAAEVVGIVLASQQAANGDRTGSLALPANTARRIADELLAHGRVSYAFLGVGVEPSPDGGATVQEVAPGSPAEAVDLQPGDVITDAGAVTVDSPGDLLYAVQERAVGDELAITYLRDGAERQVVVRLAEAP